MKKHAANYSSWAIGRQQRNGFHVRRVVWGLLMAQMERRPDEEIRAASIMIETNWKRRHAVPQQHQSRDRAVARVDDGD